LFVLNQNRNLRLPEKESTRTYSTIATVLNDEQAMSDTKADPSPLVTPAVVDGWYKDKSFTRDWVRHHFPLWVRVLWQFRAAPARVLEIGSWEGRSAIFFLNYMPQAHLTCIDTWQGGAEHSNKAQVMDTERLFDANLAEFSPRLEKIKARSADALPLLGIAGRRFDVVYVDGSHQAADVFSDAALSWPLLARGGIMIFDDYEWERAPSVEQRPQLGIDSFLQAQRGEYVPIFKGYQVVIAKRRPSASGSKKEESAKQ
jgi:predicted O-methyltransferase YrrM